MNLSFFTFLFLLSYLNPFQNTILPNDSFQKDDYCGIVLDSIPKDTIPFYYYAVEKNAYSYANVCVKKGYSIIHHTMFYHSNTQIIYPDSSIFYFGYESNPNMSKIKELGDSIDQLFYQDREFYRQCNEILGYNLYQIRPFLYELSGKTDSLTSFSLRNQYISSDSLYWKSVVRGNKGFYYGYYNIPEQRKAEFDSYVENVFFTDSLIKFNYNSIDTVYDENCTIVAIVYYEPGNFYYIYAKSNYKDYIILSPIDNKIKCDQFQKIKIGITYRLKLTFHDKLPLNHFSPDGLINIKGVNLFVDPLQNDPKKIEFGTYGSPIEERKVYSGRPASASNLNGLYYIPDE